MAVVDALSQSPGVISDQMEVSLETEVEGFVGGIVGNLPVTSNQLQRIKEEQAKDKDLHLRRHLARHTPVSKKVLG